MATDGGTTPAAATPAPASGGGDPGGGTQRQGGGRGGRGRENHRRGGRHSNTPRTGSVFKGNTPGMNGHVFKCFDERDDKKQFSKTVEILGEYIAKNLKYPGDLAPLTKHLTVPTVPRPQHLNPDEQDPLTIQIWKKNVDSYCTQVDYLKSNLKTIFAVIYGQCSESMKAKLKSLDEFEEKDRDCDCVWILTAIKGITYHFEGQRFAYLSLDDACTNYYTFKQGQDESLADYLENFWLLVEVLEHYGGQIGEHPKFLPIDIKATTTNQAMLRCLSHDYTLALSFLKCADRHRYGGLWASLENQFSLGNNQYPVDLMAAYSILVSYKIPKQHGTPWTGSGTGSGAGTDALDGMTFMQATAVPRIPGTNGVTHNRITCYRCKRKGHYTNCCPSEDTVQLLQSLPQEHFSDSNSKVSVSHFTFAQSRYDLIPSHWVLLNSQSTINIFRNRHFLTNIHESGRILKVYTAANKFHPFSETSRTLAVCGTTQNCLQTSSPWHLYKSNAALLWTLPSRQPFASTDLTDPS